MKRQFLAKYILAAVCLSLAPGLSAGVDRLPENLFGESDHKAMNAWVDSVYQRLGVRERLAQLIMPIVYPSAQEGRIVAEERRVQANGWGGVLYQRGLIDEQVRMNGRLQRASRVPMLIALDGEWGLHMRLKDAPRYPRNMGLGLNGDEQLLYDYGREVARQCRLMGIHVNFAPTVDVNSNPQNPVIGTRSFGEDPKAVARMSIAYAQGLEDGGVLSVAKHFPGHGDTSEDSHKTLPIVTADKKRMRSVELYPFAQYFKAGLGGVMTAHLRIPAYESRPIPSSLSASIVTDFLQKEMKFGGLIFTDGLEMKGAQWSKQEDIGVAALRAGNDILLGPSNPEAQLQALVEAYEAGVLTPEAIKAKVVKVLRYKWRLIVQTPASKVADGEVRRLIHTPQAEAQKHKLWQASLYYLRKEEETLAELSRGKYKRIAVLQVSKNPVAQPARPHEGANGSKLTYLMWDGTAAMERELKAYDFVFVNVFASSGVPSEALSRIASAVPTGLAYYTSPYRVNRAATWHSRLRLVIVAMEAAAEAQQAVLSVVTGSAVKPASEPLLMDNDTEDPTALMSPLPPNEPKPAPHTLRPAALRQIDARKLARIDTLVNEAIRSGAFPGCQVYVMHHGREVYSRAWGTMSGVVSGEPVSASTIYDVASITKALAMTPAMMLLVAEGKVRLDKPLSTYLPELSGTDVGRATIRSLLLHQSGLPAGLNFFTDLIDSTSYDGMLIRAHAFDTGVRLVGRAWGNPNFSWKPEYISREWKDGFVDTFAKGLYVHPHFRQVMIERIGRLALRGVGRYKYSDLGFVLLQQVAERVSGEPLDRFLARRIYAPIGAKVYFNPLQHGVRDSQIAPTHRDDFLRKQIIRGTVDDETAACLGGVSGNAGLYASANELAKVAQLLLDHGRWNGREIIPERTVRLFMNTTGVGARRALGFDKPNRWGVNHAAQSASLGTVGHFGFTGTAFWIDPEERLVFVFLSNRTYPSRQNNLLSTEKYRPRLHQLVYDALR